MTVNILNSDAAMQHPEDRAVYSLTGAQEAAVIKVERIRPAGNGRELDVRRTPEGIAVSGGINGARYRVTVEGGAWFEVRVSSRGVVRTFVDGVDEKDEPKGGHEVLFPMTRGSVIVRDGLNGYRAVPIEGQEKRTRRL